MRPKKDATAVAPKEGITSSSGEEKDEMVKKDDSGSESEESEEEMMIRGPPTKEVWADLWQSYYKFTVFMVVLGPILYHFVKPWVQDPVKRKKMLERSAWERTKYNCGRPGWYVRAIDEPKDVNTTFEGIFDFHEGLVKYKPEVLSKDPWIVKFNNFMTEKEVQAYVDHVFLDEEKAHKWKKRVDEGHRDHDTHFCVAECDDADIVTKIRNRTAKICRATWDHVSFTQAIRYSKGQYYKRHHDNHPTFRLLPAGVRLYTMLVYLEEPTKGGETHFPDLKLKVTPKAGTALLFHNTDMKWLKGDLGAAEPHDDHTWHSNNYRVEHEGMEVLEGNKKALNMWIYQYNYRDAWKKGCTSSELADQLSDHYRTGSIPSKRRRQKHVHDAEL